MPSREVFQDQALKDWKGVVHDRSSGFSQAVDGLPDRSGNRNCSSRVTSSCTCMHCSLHVAPLKHHCMWESTTEATLHARPHCTPKLDNVAASSAGCPLAWQACKRAEGRQGSTI
eukprot:1148056-Amphidinium_carterae.1